MENLFVQMENVVKDFMEDYQSDFEIDKKIMLEKPNKKFYWMVRKSGTNLLEADKIEFLLSEEAVTAKYIMKYEQLLIFLIDNGNIKQIGKEDFRKVVGSKIIKGAVAQVVLTDGTVLEDYFEGFERREMMNSLLLKNKKELEHLDKFDIVKYLSF